jgi:hypothetical protein
MSNGGNDSAEMLGEEELEISEEEDEDESDELMPHSQASGYNQQARDMKKKKVKKDKGKINPLWKMLHSIRGNVADHRTLSVILSVPNAIYKEKRDWNAEFQQILEMPCGTFVERVEQAQRMRAIWLDFERVAKAFSKKIIEELHVPEKDRTIPPQSKMGIAGGEKYIVVSHCPLITVHAKDL